MKISVYIDKNVALAQGKDAYGRKVVEVPAAEFSEAERATLSRFDDYTISVPRGGTGSDDHVSAAVTLKDADYYLEHHGRHAYGNGGTREYSKILDPVVTEATPEVVHAILAAIQAEDDRRTAAAAAKRAEAAEKEERQLLERIAKGPVAWLNERTWSEIKWWVDFEKDARADEVRAQAQRIAEERNEAIRSNLAALAAAKKAAEDAEWESQRAWILEHGSERLRWLWDEGVEFLAAYWDERLALERPGWQWSAKVDGEGKDPRNPPLEAKAILDEARKLEPEATLRWLVVAHKHDDCEDEDECPRYESTRYIAVADFFGKEILFDGV